MLKIVKLAEKLKFLKTIVVPWRNGEDAGLVYQGLVVRAPAQEIFHSNSGIAVLQKAWNSALDYSKNIILLLLLLPWHPQILADQLTLSQPGGPILPPHHYYTPGFLDLPTALA